MTFVKRNLKIFFRDKGAVFFSLLAVLIIIVLYAVFLGDVWLSDSISVEGAKMLMHTWLVSGILCVTSVTATLGAFGVMVDDRVKKVGKDFYASPVKRSSITIGYIGSAYCVGVILSIVALALGQGYVLLCGGAWFGLAQTLKAIGLILFCVFTNTSIVCFIVSFFGSASAFTAVSTVIGTLIGFLTGVYLPIGTLPAAVQTVIKVFPVSHAAALFKQVLMQAPMAEVFQGVPGTYVGDFKEYMGVEFYFNGSAWTAWGSVLVLLAAAVLFYGLALWNTARIAKKGAYM